MIVLCGLLLALAPLGFQPQPALAAPAEASLSDVFSALKLTPEPADYIAIVDTSASMSTDDRYGRVRAGLTRMAEALGPDDRVAVISFDATPTVRRPLTRIGSDRGAIVASLPRSPSGKATDIGRAIGSALDLMQRSQLRHRAAVLLFTDGKIDTDKNSPYATLTSSGWGGLRQKASSLQKSRDIAPLAIALTSKTDAAALTKVFSDVSNVASSDLGSYLSQVSVQVMKAAAISKLKPHLADPVTASLDGVPTMVRGGESGATLVLHNTNPIIPVEVSELRLTSDPAGAITMSTPPTAAIPAGGTSTDTVTVTEATGAARVRYHLTGTVSSPWQGVLTRDLGLTWSAKLTSAEVELTRAPASASPSPAPAASASPRSGRTLALVGGALGLVALALVLVFAVRALRLATMPGLTGTLSVLEDGRVIDERLLQGRSMQFTLPDRKVTLSLRAARGPDRQAGVSVSASRGPEHGSGTLFEGDAFDFDGLSITYTSSRTRMLRLIGTD